MYMALNKDFLKSKYGFDVYGRHKITADIISLYKKLKNIDKLKILDIGGQYSILHDFLPDEEITVIDPNVEPNEEKGIFRAKAQDLSSLFPNENFDVVTIHDVLEHIPESMREIVLHNALLMSKDLLIVAGPFNSPAVVNAEIEVSDFFTKVYGFENPWLVEHEDCGLPSLSDLEHFIKKQDLYNFQFSNNKLKYWSKSYFLDFLIDSNKNIISQELMERFRHYYNEEIFPYDFGQDSYRKTILISKTDFSVKEGSNIQKIIYKANPDINEEKILDKKYYEFISQLIVDIKRYMEVENSQKYRNHEKLLARLVFLKKVIKGKNEIIKYQNQILDRKSVRLVLRIADSKIIHNGVMKNIIQFVYKIFHIK